MILGIPQAWIVQTNTLRDANKELSIHGLLNDRLITRQLDFFNHLVRDFLLFWMGENFNFASNGTKFDLFGNEIIDRHSLTACLGESTSITDFLAGYFLATR